MLSEEKIKEVSKAVAQVIQRKREAANLSKNALAQKAGIAVQTVLFIENGVNSPSLTTLVRICEALGTSVDAIYQEAIKITNPEEIS